MKKFFAVLLLVMLCAGFGFAQADNSVAIDLFPLLRGFTYSHSITDPTNTKQKEDLSFFSLGLSYERLLVPHFSLVGNVDLYFGLFKVTDTDGNADKSKTRTSTYFAITAEGRYYPVSMNTDKFFIGAGIGIDLLNVTGETSDYTKEAAKDNFFGLTALLRAGYRASFANGLYLEPSIAYVVAKAGSGGIVISASGDYERYLPGGAMPFEASLRIGFSF